MCYEYASSPTHRSLSFNLSYCPGSSSWYIQVLDHAFFLLDLLSSYCYIIELIYVVVYSVSMWRWESYIELNDLSGILNRMIFFLLPVVRILNSSMDLVWAGPNVQGTIGHYAHSAWPARAKSKMGIHASAFFFKILLMGFVQWKLREKVRVNGEDQRIRDSGSRTWERVFGPSDQILFLGQITLTVSVFSFVVSWIDKETFPSPNRRTDPDRFLQELNS